MKLYSLLILTKNTKKVKNNLKAPQKSVIVIFPGCILPCKQNKSALYSTLHHIFPRLGRCMRSKQSPLIGVFQDILEQVFRYTKSLFEF